MDSYFLLYFPILLVIFTFLLLYFVLRRGNQIVGKTMENNTLQNKQTLDTMLKMELAKSKENSNKALKQQVITVRLQAYERLLLFLERIRLDGLVLREIAPNVSSMEMQAKLAQVIRSEFEHNLAQQIYVSAEGWNQIVAAREEAISIINVVTQNLDEKAGSHVLLETIVVTVAQGTQVQLQQAIEALKTEVADNFF